MNKFITNSEDETKKIGKEFATSLKDGDVIVLSGELGAGKTKFTEGVLSFFGLEDQISSPTFTIVNVYSNSDFTVNHFDVYRLEDIDEFYAIGGEEYFNNGISIIEWGEKIKDALPKNYIEVEIKRNFDNDKRELTIRRNID